MKQTRHIALGPVLAGVAALLLLVSLFLDWYEPGSSAWTVFEVIDLLLAVLALAALAVVAQELGVGLPGARAPQGVLLPLAVVALVIVVSQVIQHPPGAVDRGAAVGLWLALGAVVMLTAGAALGTSYVSVVTVGQPDDGASGAAPADRAESPPPAGTPLRAPGEEDAATQPMPPSEPERPT